jgi:hypothetical protein
VAAAAGTVNILFKSRKRAESARQGYINIDYQVAAGSLSNTLRFYFSRAHTHRRFWDTKTETESDAFNRARDVLG